MTITDQITALLSADPICGGRVTGETVRAIAGIVSEKAAIVAWLRGPAFTSRHPEDAAFARHVADAIERGDFGAGDGG